jgi:hypothetical protein
VVHFVLAEIGAERDVLLWRERLAAKYEYEVLQPCRPDVLHGPFVERAREVHIQNLRTQRIGEFTDFHFSSRESIGVGMRSEKARERS